MTGVRTIDAGWGIRDWALTIIDQRTFHGLGAVQSAYEHRGWEGVVERCATAVKVIDNASKEDKDWMLELRPVWVDLFDAAMDILFDWNEPRVWHDHWVMPGTGWVMARRDTTTVFAGDIIVTYDHANVEAAVEDFNDMVRSMTEGGI